MPGFFAPLRMTDEGPAGEMLTKLVTDDTLVNTLRQRADAVRKRLWIVSPYIGSWKPVTQILGSRWYTQKNISVRLLTDGSGTSQRLDLATIRMFQTKGEVRSIIGVHAKVYIVDDNALLTSANLTETAFTRRVEIGAWLSGSDASEIARLYEQWWTSTEAKSLPADWEPQVGASSESSVSADIKLKARTKLPPQPSDGPGVATVMTAQAKDCVKKKLPKSSKKRIEILDAIDAGPKSKQYLDSLHDRGKTKATQKLYGGDYVTYCIDKLLSKPLKECGLEIIQNSRGEYEMRRLQA
jgi:PLD-like domain